MKLDGVTMEAMEPTDAVAEALSPQENTLEQTTSQSQGAATDAAPRTDPKANGEPAAADPQTKPKVNANKAAAKSAGASGSNSRPGAASHRAANDVKASNVSAAPVRKLAAAPKSSAVGAVPKRPVGVAAVSSGVKKQTREPDKKPVGQTRSTSVAAATVTNGTRPTTVNDTTKKRPGAETVKPKTTAASRPAASSVPKPSTSSAPKTGPAASSKTTRPATAPSTSRPASTSSRPLTATAKPSTAATAKTSAYRVTTAPSTGRTAATPPLKTAPAKKADVSRPPSAAMAKKPTGATTSAGTRKPESSKPTANVKISSAPKWSTTTKAADPKVSQPRTQQPVNPAPTKKPVAAVRFPANNKLPLGRTPPASPSTKAAHSATPQAKGGIKPTQAVSPFAATKKRGVRNTDVPAVEAQCIADVAVSAPTATVSAATPTAVLAEGPADVIVSTPHESSRAASVSEDVTLSVVSQAVTPDVVTEEITQTHEAPSSPSQSPPRSDLPQTSEQQEHLESSVSSLTKEEQMPAAAEPTIPAVAPSPDFSEEPVLKDQTSSTLKALEAAANAIPQKVPHTDVTEDEDEDEREGSQLVSVSEMSGTTQPTEESRPDSVGPVGGSAWRAGGALLSELDSEEVSGSQQGASELSAPGVLEGTESMDDLGDGSLKGAIDTEGASAGSPDFEKVPDIPVNDFDEDEDEDDDDRVCDMDVGSERADEPQRPRHDNDVDDEEDEDVEMASEGVTESGLESYGNADEDDFAEDERLDNLNRVAQPPPPPLLPSAPGAQWDQPNPFVDPWAEPLQLVHMEGAAAASPSVDPWQANTETPIQTKAWLELGSSPFASDNQEVTHHSSARDKPENLDTQIYMDESNAAPSPAPVLLSAPGMSLSSTLSSETSTPEEQIQDMHAIVSAKLDLTSQDPHMEGQDGGEEEEAETLPADEVLGDPATAPTSNPSSSESEDEPSDTEGEVRLDDSVESPLIAHVTFDKQSSAQRCLSTVEEGEEAEMEECQSGAAEDTTPPSATSLASYGFDTMTTTSNSNAQSTGESCIKSPGIFSLEELPEEPKEGNVSLQPHVQPSLLEQQYIECGKQEDVSAEDVREQVPGPEETLDPSSAGPLHRAEEIPDDIQPPYYSAICEKTENSFAGFTALPHPHRRDHAAHPRTYCDIVKPHGATANPPKLTCTDLPPRSFGQQELSPQLRRLEQHQRQLLELQQRREQQNRPLEEAEQERKARKEEEQRKKEEEAGEEIKRNKEEVKVQEQVEMTKEEVKQRRDLELQLQQQQEELKQRQQIMQWQQELQQVNKGQTALLSPSSGLCTIYEALENSDEEGGTDEKEPGQITPSSETPERSENVISEEDKHHESSPSSEGLLPTLPDSPESPSDPSQEADSSSPCPPESPERPSPLDLDWGKKVDIVQQLINQTLLLNREGCSSMLLLPGGAGGTLSPLESSLWPSLLPPLTPPSATVTSVSSFSPEATGSSPQGEWTVVELETHH